MKQLSLGCADHESTHKFFPRAAGEHWVGDADKGTGEGQPGSWLYSVLPFIEDKRCMNAQGRPGRWSTYSATESRCRAMVFLPPPAAFFCPSRRTETSIWSSHITRGSRRTQKKIRWANFAVGANDYAGNAGDLGITTNLGRAFGRKGSQAAPGGLLGPNAVTIWAWIRVTPPQVQNGHLPA